MYEVKYEDFVLSSKIAASAGNEFLDDKRYIPVLEARESLGLPIYIHPGAPLKAVQEPYYGGLSDEEKKQIAYKNAERLFGLK